MSTRSYFRLGGLNDVYILSDPFLEFRHLLFGQIRFYRTVQFGLCHMVQFGLLWMVWFYRIVRFVLLPYGSVQSSVDGSVRPSDDGSVRSSDMWFNSAKEF